MQRPADKLPERREVLERRALRAVVVRRAEVHIGGEEVHVADVAAMDEAEQILQFQLAAERGAVVGVGPVLGNVGAEVGYTQADRHVGANEFPGSSGLLQFLLQPLQLG